jgi:hypothetical protein
MTAFLKRAYMAQVNKLKAAQAPPAAPAGFKPAKRAPIRPLGNGGDSIARFPKKGKNFKGEGNPTYWAELYVSIPDSLLLCPKLRDTSAATTAPKTPQGSSFLRARSRWSLLASPRYRRSHARCKALLLIRCHRMTPTFAQSAAEGTTPTATPNYPGQDAFHLAIVAARRAASDSHLCPGPTA